MRMGSWLAAAPILLSACGPATQQAGIGTRAAALIDTQPKITDYLLVPVTEARLAAFFAVPLGAVITASVGEAFRAGIGIQPSDAGKKPYVVSDRIHQALLDAEFTTYSLDYFGTANMSVDQVHVAIDAQGGYTTSQYLAFARVMYGPGRCDGMRVGTGTCLPTANDLQTTICKGEDAILNLRFQSNTDLQFLNTLAIHREDIAYRLIFDEFARQFGGYPHNPMRDMVLDVSAPTTPQCRQLSAWFANGSTFASALAAMPDMLSTVAVTSGHLLDGATETTPNEVTHILATYHYGMFNFLAGRNCSRNVADNTCYAGDPLMPPYLVKVKGVSLPREDGHYRWTCLQIANMIDVIVSNPASAATPYNVLGTQTSYQFDPKTYPLRDAPLDLTAEDVLMFFVAVSNAHINSPNDPFTDSTPLADVEAMKAQGVLNVEFAFGYSAFPVVFATYLK